MTIILPKDSNIYALFSSLVSTRRCIFLAGLPGTGKSLLLKQLVLLAQQAERQVHLLQWDVCRLGFETAEILNAYPEIDGVTHPVIRKAVGMWARGAVQQWHEAHPDVSHLLVGEVPLVGNRLIELAQPKEDDAELLLSDGELCSFVITVPSARVREVIEAARAATITEPRHEKEKYDAPPNVLRMLNEEVQEIGQELGVIDQSVREYDARGYTAVFRTLLRHRPAHDLLIDDLLKPAGSAYDMPPIQSELAATTVEAKTLIQTLLSSQSEAEIAADVAAWYQY